MSGARLLSFPLIFGLLPCSFPLFPSSDSPLSCCGCHCLMYLPHPGAAIRSPGSLASARSYDIKPRLKLKPRWNFSRLPNSSRVSNPPIPQQNHEHVQLHKLSIRGFNGAAHVPRASLTTGNYHTQRSSFQHTPCAPRDVLDLVFCRCPHNRDDFSWCTCHISGDALSARDVRGKVSQPETLEAPVIKAIGPPIIC
ncbi:hypothetical protein B0H14DRAFT_2569612 [Mycena olivaceomarginata]|nr:hypothetical protein B0H14DRAFT_2569612 [Mycena olivaceomarginata]